jgi:hypothetical protein
MTRAEILIDYIKWGFESRLKLRKSEGLHYPIISNGDLKVG